MRQYPFQIESNYYTIFGSFTFHGNQNRDRLLGKTYARQHLTNEYKLYYFLKVCYGDSDFLLVACSLASLAHTLLYFIFPAHSYLFPISILFATAHNSSIESHFLISFTIEGHAIPPYSHSFSLFLYGCGTRNT